MNTSELSCSAFPRFALMLSLAFAFVTRPAISQDVVQLASVISAGTYIVGGPNMQSGLYARWSDTDTGWTHLGPDKLRANGHAIHPSRPEIMYIAAGNGIHRTMDRGRTWKIVTGWEITEALGIVVDPVQPDNLYIATAYGVHCSRDAGETWTGCSDGLPFPPFVSAVIVDQAEHRTLYCAAETGAYRSTDAGAHWRRMPLSVQRIRCLAQSPANPSLLMAGTEDDGVYASRNGGATWTKCEAGLLATTVYSIAMHPTDQRIAYAGGYASGIYKSTDGGSTWKHPSQGFCTEHVHSIAVHPLRPDTVYAATLSGGVFRSVDAGVTWQRSGLDNGQLWKISLTSVNRK
jgi:photosystem II stability/assembly factor-like uncharacterized protein